MRSVLTALTPDLHVLHRPDHAFLGMRIGTRMTVARLPDRSLLVHSPVEPTAEVRAAIDALGDVSIVVAPNAYHHVFAGHFAAAYPKAKLVGAKALKAKRPDLRFAQTLDEKGALPDGVVGVYVPSRLDETVLYVPHLQTLICADLTENFEAQMDHLPTRLYLKAAGLYGKTTVARPLRVLFDKPGTLRAIEEITSFDFERVTLTHGRVIEKDGRRIVRESYDWAR